MQKMHFQTYPDPVTLESLRLDHSPRDGMAVVQICFYAVLTGESGTRYNIMRALPHPGTGTSMNFGTYQGTDELDEPGSLLFSFREAPAIEQYWTTYGDQSVVFEGDSFHYELGLDGYHWTDANGRIDVQAERLGQSFNFYIPRQELFEYPIFFRDHLGKVTGTIDGDKVEGIFHDTHMYTEPGKTFQEIQFTSLLENFWADWLVEYSDGSLEGGFAMRGHPETGYTIAHHYVDGRSHARSDATLEISRSEKGTMQQARIKHGKEFEVVLDQHGSFDWPLHTYGTVTSVSRADKKVVKSWNYTENWPRNWGDLERYQIAYAQLFGRYPSLRGILEKSTVVDERLEFS
ncbi:hypothetical protein [Sciscionella marina]|uniref:hypothetical protein n=1 Tax=Sciscionella marina TaxID=508770 RepID=UPI00039DAD5B|nr:hypothetical protein [Sciscionella marina]